jgi:hypothetical protein
MSNVIRFIERARNVEPLATIEAYRSGDHFRYRVRLPILARAIFLAANPDFDPDDIGPDLDPIVLSTYSLQDARDDAAHFAKRVIEIGPPEAFDDQHDGASQAVLP